MIVAKEHSYLKASAPTSAYLNSETIQQSALMSLKINEDLLKTPTNPHLTRLWKIKIDEMTVYYSTPDNLFMGTGLNKYFRNLLDYQTTSGVIEPKDVSTYKYRKLYNKLEVFLNSYKNEVPGKQKNALVRVLQLLSMSINISINDLLIQANADNELVVVKKGESGSHYIVIGDDINDVSYLFISNSPGFYTSLHTSKTVSLHNIIDSFSAE